MVHIPQLLHLTTIQFSLSLLIPYLGFSMLEAFHLWKHSKGIFALHTETAYMHHKRCVYTGAWKVNLHSCAQWTRRCRSRYQSSLRWLWCIYCIFYAYLCICYSAQSTSAEECRFTKTVNWTELHRKKHLLSKKEQALKSKGSSSQDIVAVHE